MILQIGSITQQISWEGSACNSDEATKNLYQVADFPVEYIDLSNRESLKDAG